MEFEHLCNFFMNNFCVSLSLNSKALVNCLCKLVSLSCVLFVITISLNYCQQVIKVIGSAVWFILVSTQGKEQICLTV